MNTVLSFDISSSVIGWSKISFDENSIELINYGFFKPIKSKIIEERLLFVEKEIAKLCEENNSDFYAVESYANKFPKGRSTANTIRVLSVFNEVVNLSIYKSTGVVAHRFAVSTIRSSVGKNYGTKIVSKDDTFNLLKNVFKNYKVVYNRNNKVSKECYDIVDSFAVGVCFSYKFLNGEI
tara:strand:+ start:2077 stop:2616 length:540 start_codon:yes stop_codon:yes gene_type:complete